MTLNRFVCKFYPQSILILEEYLCEVVKCKLDIMSLNVFGSISEKWMSVREKNIKLLREAITYMATTGTPTSIITTEKVMCIMHCRKTVPPA